MVTKAELATSTNLVADFKFLSWIATQVIFNLNNYLPTHFQKGQFQRQHVLSLDGPGKLSDFKILQLQSSKVLKASFKVSDMYTLVDSL